MKAIVSGFEPFGGDTINPSGEVLDRLPAEVGDLRIIPCLLPVSFVRAPEVLLRSIAAHAPDIVLAIGLAGGRADLSLERVALNVADSEAPDNDGDQAADRPLIADAPMAYFATLPIKAAVDALRREGLPASVSNTAGTFVCNALLYRLMHEAHHGARRFFAGFLHVPYLPEQVSQHPGAPSMAIEQVVRGVEIIVRVSAESLGNCDDGKTVGMIFPNFT